MLKNQINGGGTRTETFDRNSTTISDNARVVLEKRYLRKDQDGKVIETPEAMFRRVAHAIARTESLYGCTNAEVATWEEKFFEVMSRLEFVPNSPTLMNAGINLENGQGTGTLSACFVMGLEDTMDGIMTTAKEMAMVQKFGGGTGFSLSTIRPKDAPIKTTHGKACGPIAVLRHLSSVSQLVTQGGKRDGANMAVMDVHHPDIMEFINCKRNEGEIHNFNISVGASHEFMEAVKSGTSYPLRTVGNASDPNSPVVEVGRLEAREVFDKIIASAWRNGEPGLIFLDWVNHNNPTPDLGRMTATNPCGEQPLLPYESCNLGSINLAKFLVRSTESSPKLSMTPGEAHENSDLIIDYERLRDVVHTATRFLDNVIDANTYSVEKIEEMTKATRKIGLGVMGFADMLTQLHIPYDSDAGLDIGRSVMKFIREEADMMSQKLADERGVFPAFSGSTYDTPGEPRMRNACRLTVAPTGTISMIAGCSSGIEPLFALCYHKHNILGGESLLYVDQEFEKAARQGGFYSEDLMTYLAEGGSLENRDDVPGWAKSVFVTSSNISPEMHVRMQAAFQDNVDAAISKTINFPNTATTDDVRRAYMLAWELACKGITVYRAGSREAEVLTKGTADEAENAKDEQADQPGHDFLAPRQRPSTVKGITEKVRTGHGNMYVTINFDEDGRPFEVFTALGKAGGCDSAQLESISRLVSLALRSGIDPLNVLEDLRGITCCPAWDNGTLVRSAPDAVALVLGRHLGLGGTPGKGGITPTAESYVQPGLFPTPSTKRTINDQIPEVKSRCPECSVGDLVHQEGCLRCPQCGYNKCE